jgi:hypothetical protein
LVTLAAPFYRFTMHFLSKTAFAIFLFAKKVALFTRQKDMRAQPVKLVLFL